MTSVARSIVALWMVFVMATPASAYQPDEVLKDPKLEARARVLSAELRCLVCQNQSIDDSDADLARDLRILVRERLKAGDTDEEVLAFLVARYGEFVLLKPRFSMANAFLWLVGPILFAIGLIAAIVYMRRRGSGNEAGREALSDEERAELDRILKE